ncbi:MAG: transhydrogenase subunit alpha [Marmoricola sp.]|nr:transhydrogenase subunit alpha [Marmoricola sp.]
MAKEQEGETRVALVPALVGELTAAGCTVTLEPGAGERAGFADTEYAEAGAGTDRNALLDADVVLAVQPLDGAGVRLLRPGAAVISFLPPGNGAYVAEARNHGVTTFAMEQVPRISRAQPMDALTSQALVAGYRAAIVAAGLLREFFPLTMTAAGTIPAARVLVLGAGVAGLQAIATARRLGADVSGYDVRASSAEEIASLGATAVDLGLAPLDGAAGYAREMTAERSGRQRALLAPYVARADAVITTAAVPGRRAPVLVTAEMLAGMRPGSVVVDIAAESGGNVEGVRAGELLRIGGVQVWGGANVPGQMPGPASTLYARNVVNLLMLMTEQGDDGARFAPDYSDVIPAAAVVTRAGDLVNDPS